MKEKISIDDMYVYIVKVKMPYTVFVGDMEFNYGSWSKKIQEYAEELMKDKTLVRTTRIK